MLLCFIIYYYPACYLQRTACPIVRQARSAREYRARPADDARWTSRNNPSPQKLELESRQVVSCTESLAIYINKATLWVIGVGGEGVI